MSEYIAIEVAAVAFIGGLVVMYCYKWLTGCTGGHHYPDEPTDVRWKAVPYHSNSEKLGVTEERRYQCSHEGCRAEKTDLTLPKNVHKDDFEQMVDELPAYEERDNE